MQLDRALREGFERVAAEVEPDASAAIDTVFRRHSRGARRRAVAYVGAAAAASIALVVFGPGAFDRLTSGVSVPPAGLHPIRHNHVPARLVGTYSKVVEDKPGLIRTYSLAGRWTMRITATGALTLDGPVGFEGFLGVPSPASVTVRGGRLTTDALFHDALGCGNDAEYRWSTGRSKLVFDEVVDECPYRPVVLSSGSWSRTD
jgi:hypothetical protein